MPQTCEPKGDGEHSDWGKNKTNKQKHRKKGERKKNKIAISLSEMEAIPGKKA